MHELIGIDLANKVAMAAKMKTLFPEYKEPAEDIHVKLDRLLQKHSGQTVQAEENLQWQDHTRYDRLLSRLKRT